MNDNENKNIQQIVSNVIDETFLSLNISHKNILKKNVEKVCIELEKYINFPNYIQQLNS